MATGWFVIEDDVSVPADVFDLPGFRRWVHSDQFPERGRFSFLDGEVHADLSPEELQTHNKVRADLGAGLWNWVRQHDLGEVLDDGALLVHEQANLATEPDRMFCSWGSLRSGRVRYANGSRGATDLWKSSARRIWSSRW